MFEYVMNVRRRNVALKLVGYILNLKVYFIKHVFICIFLHFEAYIGVWIKKL